MPKLFEIKVIAKDTKLGAALVALEGLVYGKPEITPIRGATVSQGKIKAVNGSGAPTGHRLILAITKSGERQITKKEIVALVERLGGNTASSSSYTTMMVRKGILKRKGKGTYTINKG